MLKELATDQLPDLSRADDQRILDVRRLPPCEGPGRRSRRHDEEKSKEPKRCELRLVRVRETDEPRGGVEEPDAHGDEVEDADDLVGGRVRGALLVAVVETVELGRQDPHRQQSQEDDRLDADSDLADELGPVEEGLDDRKSRRQRQEVGREQHSPHEPAAPHSPGGNLIRGGFLALRRGIALERCRSVRSQSGRFGRAGGRRRIERQGVSAFAGAHDPEPGDGGAFTVIPAEFEVARIRPLAADSTEVPSPC